MAQLEQTATRVKSPPQTGDVSDLQSYQKYLADIVAILAKNLDYIINGNLDANNIHANSITADRMDVQELSAIAADLGHITAGLIEAVTIIGSLIQTAEEGTYPRIEFSSTNQLIKAEQNADTSVTLNANLTGNPGFQFLSSAINGIISMAVNEILMQTFSGDIEIKSTSDLKLWAGNKVKVQTWNTILNEGENKTLQQEFDGKANTFTGSGGVVYASSTPGGPANIQLVFSGGILSYLG